LYVWFFRRATHVPDLAGVVLGDFTELPPVRSGT
jgi:hypothetical protein